jgi:hypothetical protein
MLADQDVGEEQHAQTSRDADEDVLGRQAPPLTSV